MINHPTEEEGSSISEEEAERIFFSERRKKEPSGRHDLGTGMISTDACRGMGSPEILAEGGKKGRSTNLKLA